jgi:hypothetical protein
MMERRASTVVAYAPLFHVLAIAPLLQHENTTTLNRWGINAHTICPPLHSDELYLRIIGMSCALSSIISGDTLGTAGPMYAIVRRSVLRLRRQRWWRA